MSKTTQISIVDEIINHLNELSPKLPDKRTGSNTRYTMADIVLAAFAVFFTQSPSFLDHQRTLKKRKGKSNAQTIFQMDEVPCDKHVRDILDSVPPDEFSVVYGVVFNYLFG